MKYTIENALLKLIDNGVNGKNRENNGGNPVHNNYYSIGNGISEIKENNKRHDDRSISPAKRGSIMDENEFNIVSVPLDDLIRHFTLFEIFFEMEIVKKHF